MEIPQTVAMHKGRDFEDWFAKSILMDMFSMQLKNKKYISMKARQSRQSRQANLMIAVAVITGVYFVVWTLIGMIL